MKRQTLISEDFARRLLELHVRRRYGSQTRAAVEWGVSQSMVSGMLNGTKRIAGKAAQEVGLRRVAAYEILKDHP